MDYRTVESLASNPSGLWEAFVTSVKLYLPSFHWGVAVSFKATVTPWNSASPRFCLLLSCSDRQEKPAFSNVASEGTSSWEHFQVHASERNHFKAFLCSSTCYSKNYVTSGGGCGFRGGKAFIELLHHLTHFRASGGIFKLDPIP